MTVRSWSALAAAGRESGLDLVAAAPATPFDDARRILEERRAEGRNGDMQFTYRNPARSTDPDRLLPGARTLIAGAVSYHRERPPAPVERGPVARIARYVWADDQERLLTGLGAIVEALVADGARAVAVSDQNHLVDRPVAARAGLGWFGKNANLLVPGRGSWFVLGCVVTDAEVPDAPTPEPVPDGCGTCERCRPACPTDAIVAPGVVDARRCLSWTLQRTGTFPHDQRVALGDRLYGCDECQDVCPPNRVEIRRAEGAEATTIPEGRVDQAWVPVLEVLAAADDELLARHGRWYIPQRDPRFLRRNALVVLGNVGDGADPDVRRALRSALASPDPLLRAHAVWSARRLGCDDLVVDLADDPDPQVRAELADAVEPRSAG